MLIPVVALVVAVTAAARSTWSPCGVSMLSTITPIGEAARGARFPQSAAWFIVGGVAGGLTLGGVLALVALVVRSLGPSTTGVAVAACVAALVAAASDARVFGLRLPDHHRQVNETWLDRFRPWVYGAGFGWQIGNGVSTYIVTAAVYLTMVLAGLTASPIVALGIGAVFGTVRGLAVLLGRGITSSERLMAFHRRFAELEPTSRRLTIGVEVGAAAAAIAALWPAGAGIVVLGAAAVTVGRKLASSATLARAQP
jgi:hypothetical protein